MGTVPGWCILSGGIRDESKSHPECVEGWLLRLRWPLEISLRRAQDDFSLDVNEPFQISTVNNPLLVPDRAIASKLPIGPFAGLKRPLSDENCGKKIVHSLFLSRLRVN
jgi:hypothetical protein